MAKSLQRKKPGYTKAGVVKIVSLNVKQLLAERQKASKKKLIAKYDRRVAKLGYVAPAVVEEVVAE
jgi:phosphoribosylformylglycinamidine (FGAM) synthase-like enzyme